MQAADFVSTLYRHLLGRDPDAGGLRYWIELTEGCRDYAAVLQGIVQSEEYRLRQGRLAQERAQRMSRSVKLYFMHIPKTSGSSVTASLRSLFGEGKVSPTLLWDGVINERLQGDRFDVWCGHLGGLLPLWFGHRPPILTMLRHPIARGFSHFRHVQRDQNHPMHQRARNMTLEEYCRDPMLVRTVSNYQARYLTSLAFSAILSPNPAGLNYHTQLAFENSLFAFDEHGDLLESAKRAIDSIDVVGICEAHQASLTLLGRRLELQATLIEQHANICGGTQENYNDGTDPRWLLLAGLGSVDMLVYQYACQLFITSCEREALELPTSFLDTFDQFRRTWIDDNEEIGDRQIKPLPGQGTRR